MYVYRLRSVLEYIVYTECRVYMVYAECLCIWCTPSVSVYGVCRVAVYMVYAEWRCIWCTLIVGGYRVRSLAYAIVRLVSAVLHVVTIFNCTMLYDKCTYMYINVPTV